LIHFLSNCRAFYIGYAASWIDSTAENKRMFLDKTATDWVQETLRIALKTHIQNASPTLYDLENYLMSYQSALNACETGKTFLANEPPPQEFQEIDKHFSQILSMLPKSIGEAFLCSLQETYYCKRCEKKTSPNFRADDDYIVSITCDPTRITSVQDALMAYGDPHCCQYCLFSDKTVFMGRSLKKGPRVLVLSFSGQACSKETIANETARLAKAAIDATARIAAESAGEPPLAVPEISPKVIARKILPDKCISFLKSMDGREGGFLDYKIKSWITTSGSHYWITVVDSFNGSSVIINDLDVSCRTYSPITTENIHMLQYELVESGDNANEFHALHDKLIKHLDEVQAPSRISGGGEGRTAGIRKSTGVQPNLQPNPQSNPHCVGYHDTLVAGGKKLSLVIQTLSNGTISVTPCGKADYGAADTKLKFMLRSPASCTHGLDIFVTSNDSASPGRHWLLDMTPTPNFIGKNSDTNSLKGPDFAVLVNVMNTVIQFLLDMKQFSGSRLYNRDYVLYNCESRREYSTKAVKSLLVSSIQKRFTSPEGNKAPFRDLVYLQLIPEEPVAAAPNNRRKIVND
jgi:hypothetical protein